MLEPVFVTLGNFLSLSAPSQPTKAMKTELISSLNVETSKGTKKCGGTKDTLIRGKNDCVTGISIVQRYSLAHERNTV